MSSYLSSIPGVSQQANRLATILGVDKAPPAPAPPSAMASFLSNLRTEATPDIRDGVGTLAGGVAGLILGMRHKHPVLGAIAGASVGRNGPALLKPYDRRLALLNMGETGGAILGAKMFPRHPVWGFLIGYVATSATVAAAGWRR